MGLLFQTQYGAECRIHMWCRKRIESNPDTSGSSSYALAGHLSKDNKQVKTHMSESDFLSNFSSFSILRRSSRYEEKQKKRCLLHYLEDYLTVVLGLLTSSHCNIKNSCSNQYSLSQVQETDSNSKAKSLQHKIDYLFDFTICFRRRIIHFLM